MYHHLYPIDGKRKLGVHSPVLVAVASVAVPVLVTLGRWWF